MKGGSQGADINISPLIDMVFILLIFFIVTAVFVDEGGLGMETPIPVPPPEETENEPFVLRITKGGAVFLGDEEIRIEGVSSAILNARNQGALESLTIAVHEQTKVGVVAKVLDVCAGLEVQKVVTKTSPLAHQ